MHKLLFSLLVGLILSACCQANAIHNTYSQQIQEKFIQTEGAELFCRVIGQGDPIIVIHGAAGYVTQDYLLPYMTRLAEHNLVIFYDQRGCGSSTGAITPEQINIKTYIEDIDAIRKALGTEKVSLLGHSWGGLLAMHYAISHPDSIDKLILLGSAPASAEDFALFTAEVIKRLAPYSEELSEIEASPRYLAGDPDAAAKWLRTTFQTYLYRPEDVNKLNLCQSQKAVLNGFKIAKIFDEEVYMKPFNLLSDLSKLQCPTFIIHGDIDPIPFETVEHIHKAISGSKILKIDHCGHFPYIEQPEVFFEAMQSFLCSDKIIAVH